MGDGLLNGGRACSSADGTARDRERDRRNRAAARRRGRGGSAAPVAGGEVGAEQVVALSPDARKVFPTPPTKVVCFDWGLDDPSKAATLIKHLPVNQEFTCAAGREIWGFPKFMADITIAERRRADSCELVHEGRMVLRLENPEPAIYPAQSGEDQGDNSAVQVEVEKALQRNGPNTRGSAIVMDASNGDILALSLREEDLTGPEAGSFSETGSSADAEDTECYVDLIDPVLDAIIAGHDAKYTYWPLLTQRDAFGLSFGVATYHVELALKGRASIDAGEPAGITADTKGGVPGVAPTNVDPDTTLTLSRNDSVLYRRKRRKRRKARESEPRICTDKHG